MLERWMGADNLESKLRKEYYYKYYYPIINDIKASSKELSVRSLNFSF